jgi:hypothetical protein
LKPDGLLGVVVGVAESKAVGVAETEAVGVAETDAVGELVGVAEVAVGVGVVVVGRNTMST